MSLLTLQPISSELARRIVERDERTGDDWHPQYPFVDELGPLRELADAASPEPVFTMYVIRSSGNGLAVGGAGFFGVPDASGTVEIGYGLVPAARRRGLATAAVLELCRIGFDSGARTITAEVELSNHSSRAVLTRADFEETETDDRVVRFSRRGGTALKRSIR